MSLPVAARWPLRLARLLAALLRVGLAQALAYRSEFIVWLLTTNMPLVMMLLWTAVAKDAPVGRFGQAQFGAYFLLTMAVRLLTGSWVVWEMTMEIRQGTLARRLLRPVHPFLAYCAEQAAAVPLRLLIVLPLLGVMLAWLGTGQLSREPLHWCLLPLALAGAWALLLSLMLLIGALALYWDSAISLFELWLALYFVLSGYTIPLELSPAGLRAVVSWLPFRFVLSFPVELALGLPSVGAALAALAVQWLYVSALFVAALTVFSRGLRRYAVFGG